MTKHPQTQAMLQVLMAVIETVKEAGPLGAPSGPMFAAFQARGCTLSQYQQIMGALVKTGKVVLRNDCYFIAEEVG